MFDHIDLDDRDYIASQMDGDGTVDMHHDCLRVSMPKSVKSITTILRFDDWIPGAVDFRLGRGNSDADVTWNIYGETARSFSEMIATHCKIKGPQFALAATAIIGRTPYLLLKDGVSKYYENTAAVTEVVQVSRYILDNRIKTGGGHCVFNDYHITLVPREEIRQNRDYISKRLKEMKQEEHQQIVGPLSLSYIGGFADAEACYRINGPRNFMISINQSYPAILQAIQKQFNGYLGLRKDNSVWYLNICKDATAFMSAVLPYSFEKKHQIQLLLTSSESNWRQVQSKVDLMKGVCVRIGRLKTITTRAQLDELIDLYFDRQGKTLVRKRL